MADAIVGIQEEWRPCPGFERDYAVSSLGRVRRETGGIQGARAGMVLVNVKNRSGYLQINLHVGGMQVTRRVNRLVAMAFIPNPEAKPDVNHKSGVKIDNRVENLEWVTNSENERHAVENGLKASGERNGRAKLTSHDVLEIVAQLERGCLQRDIADQFGVHQVAVSHIKLGKKWSRVTGIVRVDPAQRHLDL